MRELKFHATLVLAIVGAITFSLSLNGQIDAQQGKDSKRGENSLRKMQENEGVIEFYGKVIDQYGQPVIGASVTVAKCRLLRQAQDRCEAWQDLSEGQAGVPSKIKGTGQG